ncbi:hypothetical protein ACHHYP_20390 [Achlya hypogyna]|uniref:Uncharacterized protein n=1 Tax=Achlya hypogyna TaxID=1202772 RepID=A0A1V9ZJM6_ACHHY|nr:hypothetical protein ACHHYP_20390 [Achlya hypogyna]
MTGPDLRPRTVASPIRIEGTMHDLSLSGVRSKMSYEMPPPKARPVERILLPRDVKTRRVQLDMTVGAMLKNMQKTPPCEELPVVEASSFDERRAKAADEERLRQRFKTMRMNKVFVTSMKKAAEAPFQVVQMAKPAVINTGRPPSRSSISRSSSRAGRSNQCGILLADDECQPTILRKQSLRDFEVISHESGDKVIFRALDDRRVGDSSHDGGSFEFTRWDRDEL